MDMHAGNRRPALDGVRAVAVVGVISYHAWRGAVPGGWIGVDVFFVLSGFLITWLLLEEHASRGMVSLGRFYARRALRLLPAAVVVIPAAVVLAALLDPDLLRETVVEGASSVFYVSNWVVGLHHDGHIAPGLLTHTWSLSVEEQYYLVWPVILSVLLRIGGARLGLFVTVVAIAATVVHRATVPMPGHVYFWTDTRADSLLVGSAVAIAVSLGLVRPSGLAGRLGAVSAAVLGVIALRYDQEVRGWNEMASGGYTLLALLAGSVVLGAVSGGGILAWRPLVAIGRISYGMYLWHYPINVIALRHMGTGISCLAVTLTSTIVVATFSYRWIERPFLRRQFRLRTRVPAPIPAGVVGLDAVRTPAR